ncbi:MAG: DUF4234 domain-containing protein [Candidatus Aenigmatarchaeota archaeon]
MKERSPVAAMVLSIITLGIYGIYWFYSTTREAMKEASKGGSPGLWTLGLFIPIINFVIFWKEGQLVEEVAGETDGVLIFILWIVFPPAAIYLVQRDLNTV